MKYDVQWSGSALHVLTKSWSEGSTKERIEIRLASRAIDQRLTYRPNEEGESRDAGRRVLFAPPFVVTFKVNDGQRIVRVVGLRRVKRR